MQCNRCHRFMPGTTAYDGACACGGLIEQDEYDFFLATVAQKTDLTLKLRYGILKVLATGKQN
jgi:hypothetical protein